MSNPARDERLRALLRDADPAADAPPLQPADLARIRRTAYEALASPALGWLRLGRLRFGWRPLAWAAMAAGVLLVIGLVARGERWDERSTSGAPVAVATATATERTSPPSPSASAQPATVEAAEAAAAPAIAPVTAGAAHGGSGALAHRVRRPPARHLRPPGVEQAATVAATTVAPPRQIQLTTPGGTRIVWILEPAPGR